MLALAATAFWLIFVAELGDKTLFMVLLLSARHPPLRVFAGAAAAFLLHSAIAVLLGQLIGVLPHDVIRYGSAAIFFWFGLLLLLQKPKPESTEDASKTQPRPMVTAFTLIFIAEWGDATQILGAVLVANHLATLGRLQASIAVFGGGVAGLWLGTALAVIVGNRAGRWLPEGPLRKVAGVCFLLVGAYTAFLQR
jgi:putative Ca2+/H+ antiporter (TMEM165/GDT1 family)